MKAKVRVIKSKMNRWEERYTTVLRACKGAGTVVDWRYEGLTLKLGHDCRYTPDFLVVMADGTLELHEIKGFRRDDSMVKIRAAATAFPWFRFVLVEQRTGVWHSTEIPVAG